MSLRSVCAITLSAFLSCAIASESAHADTSPHDITWGGVVATVNAERTHIRICDDNRNPGYRAMARYITSYLQTWTVTAPNDSCKSDRTYISNITHIQVCSGYEKLGSIAWDCSPYRKLASSILS